MDQTYSEILLLTLNSGAAASKRQQSPSGNTKNDGGLAHGDNKQPALNSDDAPAQSLDITVDSGRKLNVAQVSTAGTGELFSDKIVKVRTSFICVILFLLPYTNALGSAQRHVTCWKPRGGGDAGI